jgi:hypothetical protein
MKHPYWDFSKIFIPVGMSDPDYQVELVKQVQSNSCFLYSISFQNLSSYCRAIWDFQGAPWKLREAKT